MAGTAIGPVDAVPASPPRVGLLASANVRADGSDTETNSEGIEIRWTNGFAYAPEVCDGGGVTDICAVTVSDAPENPDTVTVIPVVLEGADVCSVMGNGSAERRAERAERARRVLLACESKKLENELWNGTHSVAAGFANRYLTDGNADLPEGSASLGYVTALAVLERAVGDGLCGRGMIHARRDTTTLWIQNGLVARVGHLLVTQLDTIVVPGSGYDGSPPGTGAAPSADGAWAFATSIVEVRRGVVYDIPQDVDRRDGTANTLRSRSYRAGAVTWGCLQVGVRVNHTVALSTTGS